MNVGAETFLELAGTDAPLTKSDPIADFTEWREPGQSGRSDPQEGQKNDRGGNKRRHLSRNIRRII
jgi:hypothetical protein